MAIVALMGVALSPQAATIGYVVNSGKNGNPPLDPFDEGWTNHLVNVLGHDVVVMFHDNGSLQSTVELLIISSDVNSGTAASNYDLDAVQPMIIFEYALYDEIGFTANGSPSATGGPLTLTIQDDLHPLAAGLSGDVVVYSDANTISTCNDPVAAGVTEVGRAAAGLTIGVMYEGALDINGVPAPALRIIGHGYDLNLWERLTADGLKLLDAQVAYALTPFVAPSVAITSPAFAQTFSSGANITLEADTTEGGGGAIASVEYFADGVSVGVSTTAPLFSLTWSSVPTGYYTLSARVFDVGGLSGASAPEDAVPIKVGDPGDQVTMVVGSTSLNADDQAIFNRIAGFGFDVNVVGDMAMTSNLAVFSRGIYISASVDSGNITNRLALSDIGLYNAEAFLQDDLLFTGNFDNLDFGVSAGQTNVVILNEASPLSAGLSGTLQVTDSPSPWAWGSPAVSADQAVELDDAAADSVIYGYETNAILIDGSTPAPARRVQTFYQSAFSDLNADGLRLFDAGLAWVLGKDDLGRPPTVVMTSPVAGQHFPAGDVSLVVTAADDDGDGTITMVEYFEGTNLIAISTSSPFSATWSNPVAGLYTLTAKVTDETGRTGTSAAVQYVRVDIGPVVLFVVDHASGAEDRRNDLALQQRLEAFGFTVVDVDDDVSQTSDADGAALVAVSSTVDSGMVNTKYRGVAAPVINWEHFLQDDMLFVFANSTNFMGQVTDQSMLNVVAAGSPLSAGLSVGHHDIVVDDEDTFGWGVPAFSAYEQAVSIVNDAAKFVVYGYDTGDTLADASTPAAGRRVHLGFLGNSNYDNLSGAGFALLDAAISWALESSLPVLAAPVLSAPVVTTSSFELSWTGIGILEDAPTVDGPYTPTPWPLSPYTAGAPALTQAYFRVRQ